MPDDSEKKREEKGKMREKMMTGIKEKKEEKRKTVESAWKCP